MPQFTKMTAAELLAALESAGRAPDLQLIRACAARRGELAPGLVEMLSAPPDETWSDNDPRWYARVHAGNLLIYFRDPEAVPIFFRLFRNEADSNLLDWFAEPLASYGLGILPHAQALLLDPSAYVFARMHMTALLEQVAAEYPTERAHVIEILRRAVPPIDGNGQPIISGDQTNKPDTVLTSVAASLAVLTDFGSRPQIEGLYREGWIDEKYLGDVQEYRNILLNPQPLVSASFNLFETYEQMQADSPPALPEPEPPRQSIPEPPKQTAAPPPPPRIPPGTLPLAPVSPTPPAAAAPKRVEPRVGRNDPCPCGSGRKYKHCHGRA
jgi:hypothetical protein